MIIYREIPVLKRPSGLVVTATPNGCWIEPREDMQLFLTLIDIDNYRRRPPREWMGAVVSPVAGGMYIEWPGRSPLYLTHGELQQVGSVIRKLRATPATIHLAEAI